MRIDHVEADVLIAGGGIAGLMAAISAREAGARVVVVEKGRTEYSGSGRAGNDHFWCWVPEYHGPDPDAFLAECRLTQLGYMLAGMSPAVVRTWVERSFEMVKLWEEWGIPMKHDGEYHFAGHSFPNRMMTHLKYQGANQKKVLTREARRRGAELVDRVMAFDLLGGPGGVTGALGVDTRSDRFVLFEAKSVLLATGFLGRMYPNVIPACFGNNSRPFTSSGDGRAMALRVGAELVAMESINRHAGIKYYCRSGQGSWMGVLRDPEGRPVGKYLDAPSRRYHDIIVEVDKQIFERYAREAKGPVYMDCRGISDEDLAYLETSLRNEGNAGLLGHLEEEGVDLRKNPVEFATYELRCSGRIEADERCETSVPGLYAAGDESTWSISGAAVFGWLGGRNAAEHAGRAAGPDPAALRAQAEERIAYVEAFLDRKAGPDWKEGNVALNQTLSDYAGPVRSRSMLEAGLAHLGRLKRKFVEGATAADRWELIRCLEVANLYDLAETVFVGALERRESRGMHTRVDFPYTDPLLNHSKLIAKRVDGRTAVEWRNVGV